MTHIHHHWLPGTNEFQIAHIRCTGIFTIQSSDVTIDTTNSSASTQQQKQQQPQQQQNTEETSRLSSDFRSISAGFISSSSLALSSTQQSNNIVGGGGNSTNVNTTGSGDSTPSQHRRLAKSFSVAPSQTTKGWYSFAFGFI